jgi:fructosamine-3-kinase
MAEVDNAIASWVSEAGYGEVTSSQGSGSSGWASFQKVEVTKPPSDGLAFFVKQSHRSAKEMFEGEALGLQAMFECSGEDTEDSLKIPKVFHWGDYTGGSFLVMEYLELGPRRDEYTLGRAVAKMHLVDPRQTPKAGNSDGKFGFNLDNTIGGTPQPNPWSEGGTTSDWVKFFADHRVFHQLKLAGDDYLLKLWKEGIAPRLDNLFEDTEVKPSLLHGDLWSVSQQKTLLFYLYPENLYSPLTLIQFLKGNIGSANGSPSVYDPAVYWGHHEAEWGVRIIARACLCRLIYHLTLFVVAPDVLVRFIWSKVLGRL